MWDNCTDYEMNCKTGLVILALMLALSVPTRTGADEVGTEPSNATTSSDEESAGADALSAADELAGEREAASAGAG